ncbi:hypothetical protein [Mycoplasma sp. 'Moose RK']|uniref:hypothetical protein n=1 Tax=Mycoplasma sp. 'Moose RK' TaxID=2780095 RepID=UPI0018C246E4|nr:hypothetical protein [Mycoplasma sp. 'Moose RK']MBG0731001.1 hypothetical protein [Mycoplasma sp. 'Moose RK']
MQKINLKIFTPKGIFFESEFDAVTVMTEIGYRVAQFGITPFAGVIKPSILFAKTGKISKNFELKSGLVYASKVEVLIFSENEVKAV